MLFGEPKEEGMNLKKETIYILFEKENLSYIAVKKNIEISPCLSEKRSQICDAAFCLYTYHLVKTRNKKTRG